jgi:hypothetical protein
MQGVRISLLVANQLIVRKLVIGRGAHLNTESLGPILQKRYSWFSHANQSQRSGNPTQGIHPPFPVVHRRSRPVCPVLEKQSGGLARAGRSAPLPLRPVHIRTTCARQGTCAYRLLGPPQSRVPLVAWWRWLTREVASDRGNRVAIGSRQRVAASTHDQALAAPSSVCTRSPQAPRASQRPSRQGSH